PAPARRHRSTLRPDRAPETTIRRPRLRGVPMTTTTTPGEVRTGAEVASASAGPSPAGRWGRRLLGLLSAAWRPFLVLAAVVAVWWFVAWRGMVPAYLIP